jgi:pimeloyl-ACP methyl ester carboxylesterase
VHFLHVRSPEPDALPLICTHGWPMSVFEYLDLAGPLSDPRAHGGDPADAFHVVIPSVPGIAFSGPTTEPGWDTRRAASGWVELMARLGYERYGAHGNDAGSQISPEVGRHDPERVVGVHVTQLFSFPSGDPAEFADMSDEDMAAMKFLEGFTAGGGLAYNTYQSAQPQTLTYALQDSPAGWLAWVTQFFQRSVEPDYIMVNASAYWLTNTIDSSIRRYYEVAHAEQPTEPTTTPPASRSSRTISRPSDASPSATTPTSSAGTATTAAATSHPTTPPTSYSATSGSSSAPCGDRRARSPRSVQPEPSEVASGCRAARCGLTGIAICAASRTTSVVGVWSVPCRGHTQHGNGRQRLVMGY